MVKKQALGPVFLLYIKTNYANVVLSIKDLCLKGINSGIKTALKWGGYHAQDYLFVNLNLNFNSTFYLIF